MSALVGVVHVGTAPPLGGGVQPRVVAHLYGGNVPRFVAHEVDDDGTLDRVPGAYAPDLEADPAYPITDLLLATCPDLSSVGQRLEVLSTKAEANYGAGFREKVFDSDVARGSPGYGRLFEARSQLESHPFEGTVAVGLHRGASERVESALRGNLERLDARTDSLTLDGA